MFVKTEFLRRAALTRQTGVGGPLVDVRARLYSGSISATDKTVLAEMDAMACTFTGAVTLTVVWSAVFISGDREPTQQSQNLLWICTAAPDPTQTISGIYYWAPLGPDMLLAVEPLESPIQIRDVGDFFEHILRVK